MNRPHPRRSRIRWPHAAAAAAAVLWPGTAAAAAPARVVYLNFSDGTESLVQDTSDDATRNRSELCAAERTGRWLGAEGCGDREACKRAIVRETEALWAPFNIIFTTRRPASGPYTMAIIGPASGSCGFGVDGAAPVDCGDRNPANVAFAFQCAGPVRACARVLSHEVAHTLGLAHSDRSCDLMSADAPTCAEAAFHDEEARVHGTTCGEPVQNSYRVLLGLLGPRPEGPAAGEAGGCRLAPGNGRARGLWVVWAAGLAATLGARARRRWWLRLIRGP
jgi:hypothetical protein